MKLRDILQTKGDVVHTTTSDATLKEVIDLLVENNCGSLVVMKDGRMEGIITERDILRAAAAGDKPLEACQVRDHMSAELVTGSLNSSVGSVMGLMTKHRIRHLPVCEEDKLVGIISIGDVVKAQSDQLSVENHYLKNYIQS